MSGRHVGCKPAEGGPPIVLDVGGVVTSYKCYNILFMCMCVIELFVLAAGDLGGVNSHLRALSWTSVPLASRILH